VSTDDPVAWLRQILERSLAHHREVAGSDDAGEQGARCEAELAILDRCEAMLPPDERDLDEDYHDGRDDWERWRDEAVAELADDILTLLLRGYRFRAGYREEWGTEIR
jgi:hypothetical protein